MGVGLVKVTPAYTIIVARFWFGRCEIIPGDEQTCHCKQAVAWMPGTRSKVKDLLVKEDDSLEYPTSESLKGGTVSFESQPCSPQARADGYTS